MTIPSPERFDGYGLGLSPRVKYYLASKTVSPFLWSRLNIAFNWGGIATGNGTSLDAGLGAEWFLVRRISFAVSTGLRLGRTINTRETTSFATTDRETTATNFLQTVKSLVNLQLYF